MKRIIIFGSSFNPPHKGHLVIIKKVLKEFNPKKLLLMPSAFPPLKSADLAPLKHRLAMAKILAKAEPRVSVSKIEVERAKLGKKSYTLETIGELKNKYPGAEIFWVIGEDSLWEIIQGKWHGGVSLLNKVHFIVISRPNLGKSDFFWKSDFPKIKLNIPISSTQVREFLREGKSVAHLVPKEILNYIKKHKLYVKS